MVIGINWYEGMFDPGYVKDATGTYRITVVPTGAIAGGHCLLVNGVNVEAQVYRLKNSWGRGWGANGRASISFSNMARLLSEDGEACAAMELKL